MSKPIRIHARVVYDFAYEVAPKDYDTSDVQEILATDRLNAAEDLDLFLEGEEPTVELEIAEEKEG